MIGKSIVHVKSLILPLLTTVVRFTTVKEAERKGKEEEKNEKKET